MEGREDVGVMGLFALFPLPLLYTGRFLHRVEGVALLAVYGGYLALVWP